MINDNKTGFSRERFHAMPLVGILRNIPADRCSSLLETFYAAGLRTIEVTFNSADFRQSIEFALKSYDGYLNIGAGTVCSAEELQQALDAGAQFIVTPVVSEEVISTCKSKGIPVFAGAYTATEIFRAWKLGADMVKVFPATGEALEYMKAIRGPFPQIRLLPTGGVNLDNCIAFLEAGAGGLGIGNQLFNKQLLQPGREKELKRHFSAFAEKINSFLQEKCNS